VVQIERKEVQMVFESMQKGPYELIRILDDLNLNSDLSRLQSIVERNIAQGRSRIALSFTQNSFLYTHHIAVLIKCLELIKDAAGEMAVVQPNADILDVLSLIDPDGLIKRLASDEDLLKDWDGKAA
jgi:hypothetical protein